MPARESWLSETDSGTYFPEKEHIDSRRSKTKRKSIGSSRSCGLFDVVYSAVGRFRRQKRRTPHSEVHQARIMTDCIEVQHGWEWIQFQANMDQLEVHRDLSDMVLSKEGAEALGCDLVGLVPLPQAKVISFDDERLECTHQITANWRFEGEHKMRDRVMYITDQLAGKRLLCPRPTDSNSSPSLIQPSYSTKPSKEKQAENDAATTKAKADHDARMAKSHDKKAEKFARERRNSSSDRGGTSEKTASKK